MASYGAMGFAEGFAKGMEKNFREWASEEKDAAAVAESVLTPEV